MNVTLDTLDSMLAITAALSYPFETEFYKNSLWEKSAQVLDLGCGNGDYASFLSKSFPEKNFTLVEPNERMGLIARNRHNAGNFKIVVGSYPDLQEDIKYDFIVSRLVITHLPDRKDFYSWAYNHLNQESAILVIDTDYKYLDFGIELPLFSEIFRMLSVTNRRGGLEGNQAEVETELSEAGFRHVSSMKVQVDCKSPETKDLLYLYMQKVSRLALGQNLPPSLDAELAMWKANPSPRLKYGMFGALYKRE